MTKTESSVAEPGFEGYSTRRILGIDFYTGDPAGAIQIALRGGLTVVPSAPVLVSANVDAATLDALQAADLVITDSGLMVLYWNITRRARLRRLSGLEYLKRLLAAAPVHEIGAIFWVMPSVQAKMRNRDWMIGQGFSAADHDFYVAPIYPRRGPLEDQQLLDLLCLTRPKHIILAIGGGVQERLGHYLQQHLDYRPGIHGIGAAIGFLNGDQVHIPDWADRFFLGWLFRCFQAPRRFIPRYWHARKLIKILWRFGEDAPRPERMK